MEIKKQFGVVHQKFEDEAEYRDVKPADQSADNDTDKIDESEANKAKKDTDEAYLKNSRSAPVPQEKNVDH